MELGQLSQLEELYLGNNQLTHHLPSSLGNLDNVESIDFSNNRLSGMLPASLVQLSQLRRLNVSYNRMEGALPAVLSSLTFLTHLVLHDNQFTGELPAAWANFSSLAFLNISMNDLQGDFPNGFNNISSLDGCYLFDNRFTFQTIEPFFTGVNTARVTNFQYAPQDTVRLASADSLAEGDALMLTFPTTAQQNQYTWQKQISGEWQPIEGATQQEYTINSVTLTDSGGYRCVVTNQWATQLTLYTHPVTVTVEAQGMDPETEALHEFLGATTDLDQWPESWKTSAPIATWEGVSTENARVTAIQLKDKNIDSEIPESFGNLTELRKLELAGNRLRGPIPKSLGRLQQLEVLDLQRNRLTGPIPQEVGQLSNLQELNLQKNQLTGSVPPSVGQLKKVYNLRLNSNQLSGTLPSEVGDMTNLRQLFVNKNKLTGPIPPSIGRLSDLRGLHLEENQFSGPIPAALGNPPQLEQLYLHKNRLSGPVPASFGKLSRVKTLSLHQNRLEGRIPNTWVNMRNLEELNISNNNFTYLPDFSRHPLIFRRFDVRRNRLTFESLIPHHHFAPFRYDPQKPVGIPRIIDINDCNPLSLDYNVDLNIRNNRYDWYWRNELWIDTSYPSIRLDIPTRHYSGSDRLLEYYARVSNPAFPGFYLRTQPITLRNNLTQTCNTATASSEPYNYVKTETVLRQGRKGAFSLEFLSKLAKETHYDYIDGLGRVMQQVDVHGSPSGKAIVQPIEYDPLGRVAKSYLPYVANNFSGSYRTDAIAQVADFYQADDDKIANTRHPYAVTIYEASPLGRVLEQGAVGEVWQPTTPGDDDNKTMKYEHRTNRAREVRWWKLQDDGISSNYFRQPGQLYVAETRDEDNRKVITFTDKRGLLLQKQAEGDDGETLQTHYIYDDFGNLRVVIPPKAVAALYSNGYDSFSFTSDFIREGCYLYEYDERQRMISQQVPGANPVEMVYDAGDRLVLTQDGNQRKKGQWSFTKYDHLNRPIINGLINNSSDRAGMQSSRKNKHSVERYIGTQDNAHVNHFGYSNQSYPDTDNASVEVLAVTYYDNYRFTEDLTWGGGYRFSDVSLQGDHPASYPTEYFPRVQGLVTATQTRVLGTDDWLYGAVYYDDEYRPIQTNSSLYPGGGEVVTSQYDFVGRILHTLRIHQGADAGQGFEEHYRYAYDHMGRVTKVYHRLTNGGEVLLASYAYNELGEVVEKSLHQLFEDDEPLQSLDYRYNERGWLISMDSRWGATNEREDNLYSSSLEYDVVGRISENAWRNQSEPNRGQRYNYSYDAFSRLKQASHFSFESFFGGGDDILLERYGVSGPGEEKIKYDPNGNLLSLARGQEYQPADRSQKAIDILTYDYGTGVGNQLQRVTDEGTDEGFTPGEGGLEADYYYDENGNLTDDYHKGTTTTYNHLNLPEKISTATGDEIRYTYDAAGTKLMQEVVQDGITQRTVYQNGVEYRSLNYTPGSKTVLAHIMTPEGRVLPLVEIDNTPECEPVYFPDPQNWTYHYDIKDHLGNVRITLSDRRITDTYLATMESERADSEKALFGNINEDIREQDVLYNTTGECDAIELPDEMAHLNAVVGKITGPTKSLMVQNGDVVRLEVQAQYRDNTESNETAMGSVLPSLLSALGIPTGGEGAAQVAYQAFDALFGAKVLLAKDNTDPVPYAYLHYQLFNINFQPVPTVAGMIGVSEAAATGPELLESNDIEIPERGFLYVWLSNESQWDVDVFFDDFRVEHEHSEIIQAQDYYPFGGPIQRFAGYHSKYLFQSKEWQSDLGLNLYDFHARQYDPWLGRFSGIDPLASS